MYHGIDGTQTAYAEVVRRRTRQAHNLSAAGLLFIFDSQINLGIMSTSTPLLANRYRMIRQLASGSFAETWLATDTALDRYVAIKVLHTSHDREPEQETGEFLREARIAASVSHPNVVAVFDAGTTGERPILVMEWVDGVSLKQEIVTKRRMSPERSITVVAELLDGLDSIHNEGIIHRDIKPQNIMVNEYGTVKLTDFGIARLTGESESMHDGTATGSAAYMSPEQAQGLSVTPASDMYATGVILYEMMTGRLPFRHEDPQEVLRMHISQPVIRPRRLNPSIPPPIEAIIMQALEKDPDRRFGSALEMRQAMLDVRQSLMVRRPGPPEETGAWERSGIPKYAWVAASIALVIIALAGATTLAIRDVDISSTTAGPADPSPTATAVPEVETPAVAIEREPTVTPVPEENTNPQWERREGLGYDDDRDVIRGEIVIDDPDDDETFINRPAPNREATEQDQQPQQQQVAAANPTPTPQPTATPEPTPEPTATPDPPAEQNDQPEGSNDGDEQQEPDVDGDDDSVNADGQDSQNNDSNADGQDGGPHNDTEEGDQPVASQGHDDGENDEDVPDDGSSSTQHRDNGEPDGQSDEPDDTGNHDQAEDEAGVDEHEPDPSNADQIQADEDPSGASDDSQNNDDSDEEKDFESVDDDDNENEDDPENRQDQQPDRTPGDRNTA